MEKVIVFSLIAASALWHSRSQKGKVAEEIEEKGNSLSQVVQALKGKKAVCVFLGSSSGKKKEYIEAAQELGEKLAKQGIVLVYGGGNVGLMGAVCTSHKQAGGEVVGIIPRPLSPREISGTSPADWTIYTDTMHERKAIMAALSSAFIVLPGGFGTMEECVEVTTWTQLGIHRKPVGLLNTCGFWEPLQSMFEHACTEGFIREESLRIIVKEDTVDGMLGTILAYEPPQGLSKSWKSGLQALQQT